MCSQKITETPIEITHADILKREAIDSETWRMEFQEERQLEGEKGHC
jgi:hypothetical protein